MPLVDATGVVDVSEAFDADAAAVASVCFEIDEEAMGSLTAVPGCSDVGCDVGVGIGAAGGGKRAEIVEY